MIIQNNSIPNYNGLLDDHIVLFESSNDIPLIESQNGKYELQYGYIKDLMETYGYDLDDAINKVLSENGLGINNIEVSILESDALLDLDNIYELNEYGIDYYIHPISDNDIISKYTDYMIEGYINTGNEDYFTLLESPELLLLEEDDDGEMYDRKNLNLSYKDKKGIWSTDSDYGHGRATVYDKDGKQIGNAFNPTDDNFLIKIKRFLTDKPRDFLAKTAARLREVYRKWLIKANKQHDDGKIKWYKKIARKIMQAVDWILRKIEGLKVNYMKRLGKGLDDKMSRDKNISNIKVFHGKLKSHTVNRNELNNDNFSTNFYRNDRNEAEPTVDTAKKIYMDMMQRSTSEGRKYNNKQVNKYYDKVIGSNK